ncbi:hypothetical protein JCM31598_28000 [Desulfonatronum parangueonense]
MAASRWLFLEAAKYYGAGRYHVGVSCGPFAWSFPERLWRAPLVRNALNRYDILFVRDKFSRPALTRLGIATRVVDSTDAAVFLKAEPDKAFSHVEQQIYSTQGRPRAVVCVRDYQPRYVEALGAREANLSTLASVLDYVQQTHADVFFLGTDHQPQPTKQTDLQIAHLVRSRMKIQGAVIIEEEVSNAAALKYLYGKFDLMISMRLHPTILALDAGVPSLIISYDPKCNDFFQSVGLADYVASVTDFTYDWAKEKIEEIFSNSELPGRIRSSYAELRKAHKDDWEPMFANIEARIQALLK